MLRQVNFTKPNREHGLQDILEEYVESSPPIEWNFHGVFEGVDPTKRQALALVCMNLYYMTYKVFVFVNIFDTNLFIK